ncbi:MerR family transcriptional regulator [Kitasatospora sp. NBC_01302]|uniref:MerR family transcriptional regulator n=1 Tax=Kitasatospora sp. NBC_01302 TaxID=2903575 RepID=UPI002E0F904B|nr:MerR family transcriptional regulator [Kitasatospora sp. NBC_01302]
MPEPATPQPFAEVSLTTGGVARRLGVSPTTVRSWERRYGIGPAHREAGHHRRWSPQDIAVLEAMCRLTARGVPPAEAARAALASASALDTRSGIRPALQGRHPSTPRPAEGPLPPRRTTGAAEPPSGAFRPKAPGSTALPVGPVRPECRGLARAAVRLDTPEVARMLRAVVDDLGPITAWTEVMMPALRAAGRKWAADGERYVEVEHLLSWHVSSALRHIADRPDTTPDGPPVLLAGMPAELHTLPLEAVAAALAERGLPFRMFGPAVPPQALLEAVRRTGPAAVMLWSQTRQTADRTLALRAAQTAWGGRGSRARPVILTAGPGWAGTSSPQGFLHPRDLRGAVDLLAQLLAGGPPSTAKPNACEAR